MEIAKKNYLTGFPLLGAALFFSLFHFAFWPLVWHGVFLPHVESENHQLRVESYFPHRVTDTLLILENPDSALRAYAVWQVSQGGLYHLRLTCDDNGKVSIDDRPAIVLEGLSSNNVGETKIWLTTGPHFLELHLNNGPEKGWLKIEVKGPGQTQYIPLDPTALSYLKIGNIETWLKITTWGEYLGLFCFLGLSLLWLGRFYFHRRKQRLFPNRHWKYFFLVLAVVTLCFSVLYHLEHPLPPIWSDGLGYYAYLPAYLIYHDLSMESLYQATRRYDYPTSDIPGHNLDLDDGEGFIRYPVTGRYLDKYSIGTAVLMLPFFLLGHLASALLGFTADGFSVGYQFAIAISSLFYMMAGLFILFKMLIRYFPPRVVLFTLLSLFLGTNLLAYASLELSLSHAYSFFLICLLLYATPRWYNDPSGINTLFLGFVAGLMSYDQKLCMR